MDFGESDKVTERDLELNYQYLLHYIPMILSPDWDIPNLGDHQAIRSFGLPYIIIWGGPRILAKTAVAGGLCAHRLRLPLDFLAGECEEEGRQEDAEGSIVGIIFRA